MKVIDQLVFLAELRGLGALEAKRRATQWCERLQMADSIDKRTEELSKGMQQKIQFISTLLHDPELIIMDEPFSGLDPVNAVLLQDVLMELKKNGNAVLFSTHRMDQVEKLCDSICLINRGERNRVIVQFEGSDEFLKHPAIAEVKSYAGHAEIKLKPRADAQDLLRTAAATATITKFELVEPSLEEIFIETVGGRSDA